MIGVKLLLFFLSSYFIISGNYAVKVQHKSKAFRPKRYRTSYNYLQDDPLPGYNGQPCQSYIRLNQPQRSTGHHLDRLTSNALCDRALRRRWYRFEGPAGSQMPEHCVPEFSCGTHAPIWMNASHPSEPETMADVAVCASLGDNCCVRHWFIKVANCGDFFTYLLPDTPGCFMAYCAGNEVPCPSGTSSSTGYTPNCQGSYPNLTGNVHLSLNTDQDAEEIEFFCDYDGELPNGGFIITKWYVQGENEISGEEGTFPIFIDTQNEGTRSILGENHWPRKLGSLVWCEVFGAWMNGTGVYGPPLKSQPYFAGIKISNRTIHVSESDMNDSFIEIQATVPVICSDDFKDVCGIDIQLAHDSSVGRKRCIDGNVQDVLFGDCSVRISPENWKNIHRIPVRAVRDFRLDGNRVMRVGFKPIISTLASALWNNYQMPDVEIVALDVPTRMCSATGDPHISTFDGLYYNLYLEGEFVFYKNTKLPFQINTRLERCGRRVTCNCGVAVKVADDVIVIDRCERKQRNEAFGDNFPEGWKTIHRHALEQGNNFVNGLRIYEYDDGKKYTIHLPTGSYVEFRVGRQWVNMYFHASSDDWQSTIGLCGTFDGNTANDMTLADGVTNLPAEPRSTCGNNNNTCQFAESWRVLDHQSFFSAIVEVPLEEHMFVEEKHYCKCELNDNSKPQLPGQVVCDYDQDFSNCQSDIEIMRGIDITEQIIITPHFRRKRRDIDAGKNDIPMDDYFSSTFSYDAHFVGQEPQWPTASGISEAHAIAYCQSIIHSSTVAHICLDLISSKIDDIINSCVTDIKVTDNTEWAMSALEDFTSECVLRVHDLQLLWPQSSAIVVSDVPILSYTDVVAELCSADCSAKGRCYNGSCICNSGYSGADCSVPDDITPQITMISGNGLCDIREHTCQYIRVYGTNFNSKKRITCRFRQTYWQENNDVGYYTSALFQTFEELLCPIPADVLSVIGTPTAPSSSVSLLLSIIQDTESDSHQVVIYDSTCVQCDVSLHFVSCHQKQGTCLVDGQCYQPGEKNSRNCCKHCDPSVSQTELVSYTSNAAPVFEPPTSSFLFRASGERTISIQALDPEHCDVRVDFRPWQAHPAIAFRIGQAHLTLSVENFQFATYSFLVRATDSCGLYNEKNITVQVVGEQKPKSHISAVECSESNIPPILAKASQYLNVVHRELLVTRIEINDPDGQRTPKIQIQHKSSPRLSVDKRGYLRFVAPPQNSIDTINIIAEDECGKRAQFTITIETGRCKCHHNGICRPTEKVSRGRGHYRCLCKEGYSGTLCEHIVTSL